MDDTSGSSTADRGPTACGSSSGPAGSTGGGPSGDFPSTRTVSGIADGKNELVHRVLETEGVDVYGSTVALIGVLRSHEVLTAVVSASENTTAVLAAAGLADLFDVRVDGLVAQDLQLAGKPAPDTYREAARRLGVPPGRAVVVEDALVGVEAGRSGGFGMVVGVDRHGQGDALAAHGADVVVADLGELLP